MCKLINLSANSIILLLSFLKMVTMLFFIILAEDIFTKQPKIIILISKD